LSPDPLLLAIESATEVLSTALMRGESVLAEAVGEPGQHHAETVLRLVDEVLGESGVSLEAVEAFAVSIGPGSFTSLRIGLSTVKGLAFGDSAPVAPISTLRTLAWAAGCEGGSSVCVVPLLDARRGEAYAAGYRWRDGELEEILSEGVYFPDALARVLPGPCVLVGEGAALFGEALRKAAPVSVEIGSVAPPRAVTVGVLGARCLAAGGGVAVSALAPRYLRRTQAEEVQAAGERLEGGSGA